MDDTPDSLSLALDEFARFLGEHPSAVIEIEVASISDEHDLRRGRDPFEDLGLVVKEDNDAVHPDDFGLGLHGVDEDQFVVVNLVLS